VTGVTRTQIMGVVNVTPDSFSDGGDYFEADAAIAHGVRLLENGADLLDVGGESTRPGAAPVDRTEEQQRILPVIAGLAAAGATVSVDTMWADTAAKAVEAGATIINDVSGGRADPQMLRLAAEANLPFVLMHWRAHSPHMQDATHTHYDDLVAEVIAELSAQVQAAERAGVEQIIIDPGLGFSKTGDQNWTLLSVLDEIESHFGRPLLVAASRKRFLGELLAAGDELRAVDRREDATAAVSTIAALAGAWAVRVHDPKPSADAVRVAERLLAAREGSHDEA
jgi:dihydropteroate synthase